MIYEFRDYIWAPGGADVFQEAFARAKPYRDKYSKMSAFFRTEIGNVNEVIDIWPYEDLIQRATIREQAERDPEWPPKFQAETLETRIEIYNPAPFMRPHWGEPLELGNIYEMRTYMLKPGSTSEMIKRWGECLPYREKLSPLAGCWFTDLGPQFKWVHLWPYKNYAERAKIRDTVMKDPQYHWPPPTEEFIVSMENKILIPAPFSPMH